MPSSKADRVPLTQAQSELLRVLEWMGPTTTRELAVEMHRSIETVQGHMQCLLRCGWVAREPHPDNRTIFIYRSDR